MKTNTLALLKIVKVDEDNLPISHQQAGTFVSIYLLNVRTVNGEMHGKAQRNGLLSKQYENVYEQRSFAAFCFILASAFTIHLQSTGIACNILL